MQYKPANRRSNRALLLTYPKDTVSFSGAGKHILSGQELKTFLNEAEGVYKNVIVKRLWLVNAPKMSVDNKKVEKEMGKNFDAVHNFIENHIYLSDRILTNHKMVRIYGLDKKGAETPLFNVHKLEPSVFPSTEDFNKEKEQILKNTEFIDLIAKPFKKEDRKKLFIQVLAHELVHSAQYELMAMTEGIGIENLVKIFSEPYARENNLSRSLGKQKME